MATPTWDNTEPLPAPKWEETTEVKATSAAPTTSEAPGWFQPGSQSEAIVRGASQGATLGFGDEIQAGVRSVTGQQPGESILDAYRRLRDEQRMANSVSAQANPGTYNIAQAAGSLPSTLVAPSTGVVKGAAFNAIQGALAGAGNSDADSISGVAQDAGAGAALTAGAGLVGKAIGSGVQSASNVVNNVAQGAKDRLFQAAGAAGDKMAVPIREAEKKFGFKLDDVLQPAYKESILPSATTTAKTVGKGIVENVKNQFTKMDPADWALGAIVGGTHGFGLGAAAVVGKKMLAGATADALNASKDKIMNNAAAVTAVAAKFAPTIKEAVQKGTPFAAINNVLQQQSPEYREMLRARDKLKEEGDQE